MRVAFLGLGKMGRLMAGRLLLAGHQVTVWNRTPGAAAALAGRGVREAASPREAAEGAEAVVTMLFDGAAVREVLLGAEGAAAGLSPGALVLDCSTIGPEAARALGRDLGALGVRFVDAPVAGSLPLAAKGELGSFLGGTSGDVADARALVEAWAAPDKIRHTGGTGSGQAMKLVINTSLAIAVAGVGECLRLARDLGLEKEPALDVLAGGPFGWTLAQKRSLLEAEDYTPATFALDAMTKDVGLAVAAAEAPIALTRAVLAAADAAMAAGYADDDHAALAGHLAFEGEPDSY